MLANGATGTNLFRAGLETGYPPELWNVERPEDIAALHNIIIDAGAKLILTNSLWGTALRLRLLGAEALLRPDPCLAVLLFNQRGSAASGNEDDDKDDGHLPNFGLFKYLYFSCAVRSHNAEDAVGTEIWE